MASRSSEQRSLHLEDERPWRRPRLDRVVVLMLAGALAFLLPFGTVSCNGETVDFTGIELATRNIEPDPASAAAPDKGLAGDVESDGAPYALLALVCALFGAGSAAWRGRGGAFAAVAEIALLVLLLDTTGGGEPEVHIAAGYWIALASVSGACLIRFTAARETRRRRRAAPHSPPDPARVRRRVTSLLLAGAALGVVTAVELANQTDTSRGAGASEVDFVTSDWSPAWSPDGGWIAFTSNRGKGGVFRIRADGSCLVRIADGYEPSWSPDGRRLAFLQDAGHERSRLVTATADGRQTHVVAVGRFTSPQWSRDGRTVYVEAATGEFTTAAFAISLATGRLTRLAPRWVQPDDPRWSHAAVSETGPSVSPDGRFYAFESSDDPTVGLDEPGERLFVREAGKPGRTALTHPVGAGDWEPSWSADGHRIAFQRSGEIGVVDVDGTDTRVLTSVEGAGEPAWSPDGRFIVFSRELYGGGYGDNPSALEIVEVATAAVRQLTWGPSVASCD